MTIVKRVADWRIQIFLDDDQAELIKANEIVEDGVVISRTSHSTFVCKASEIDSLNALISEIQSVGAVRGVPEPIPEMRVDPPRRGVKR